MQKPATLELAFDLANEADPIVFQAQPREHQPSRPPGGPHHLAGTRSRSNSPAPFSRSQSASRERSHPQGTPLSALSQLKSLLAALEQGAGAENRNPNGGRRASSALTVPLSATQTSSGSKIEPAKAGVKYSEGPDGKRRRIILKMDDAQREYCRENGLYFRCRNSGCPWGACKNPPHPPPRFSNVEDDAEEELEESFYEESLND